MSNLTLFQNKQIRRSWNQAEAKWYFAIADVIAVLTESNNPHVYWRVMKRRFAGEENKTVTKCNALKRNTQGLSENQQASQVGGAVAGNARKELEEKSGTRVSTPANPKTLPESQGRALRSKKPSR